MKTVQVRIAVVVDDEGNWHGAGDNVWDDTEAMGEALGCVRDCFSPFWLTAELPIPAPQTVEAKVEGA